MSLAPYSQCNISQQKGKKCPELSSRCDICLVDTERPNDQLVKPLCLDELPQKYQPKKLIDWSITAPGSEINQTCYKIAGKENIDNETRCYNGGIYDIYSQNCICTPGWIGRDCRLPTKSCVGDQCVLSKNSHALHCDLTTCKQSLINIPKSKPFTIKDFLILFIILFILLLPVLWIGLIKGFNKKKIINNKIKKI